MQSDMHFLAHCDNPIKNALQFYIVQLHDILLLGIKM